MRAGSLIVGLLMIGCASGKANPPDAAKAGRVSSPVAGADPELREAVAPDVAVNPGIDALNRLILSAAARPGADADPRLGAGDLIEVSVFEVEELSKLKIRIPRRGVVRLPLLGALPAAGRTVSELEDDIRSLLGKRYMYDPQVSVFVLEYKSHTISVTGAVTRGGVHPLSSRLRISDALALAEGLAPEAETTIYLVRRVPAAAATRADGESGGVAARAADEEDTIEVTVPIDLDALTHGQPDLNVALQAGDVVHVPRASSYYVGGQVDRPGSFPLRTKTTLQQALLAAGGVRDRAAWGDIRLYRVNAAGVREVTTVDLDEIEANRRAAPEIQKNDVVIVGKHYGKTALYEFRDFMRGAFSMGKGF